MNVDGLRPIRGPIAPGFWEQNWIWAAPVLLVGAALLLFLFFRIRKALRKSTAPSPEKIFANEAEAIRRLIERNETGEVPSRLSRVLREYIEASTGVRAPEQTTEEFLAGAGKPGDEPDTSERVDLPPDAVDELRPFLALTDEAKFARKALGSSECAELLSIAERFVAANESRRSAA